MAVPDRRGIREIGQILVFAAAPVVDVDVNDGRCTVGQVLLLKGPVQHLLIGAAEQALGRPVPRIGGQERIKEQGRIVGVADRREGAHGAQHQIAHQPGRELSAGKLRRVAADRAVNPEHRRRKYLLAAIGAVVVHAAPAPAIDHGAIRPAQVLPERRANEPVNRTAIVPLGQKVVQDDREAVAGAVREPEIRRVHVVVEDAVPAEFVQDDRPFHGIPHIPGRGIDQAVACVVDPVAITDAMRVVRHAEALMIDVDRKTRAVEIVIEWESQALNQPEEAVVVVIGVHRAEIVGPHVEVEVAARGPGRRRDGGCLDFNDPDQIARERLGPRNRRIQPLKHHVVAQRVQHGVALCGVVAVVARARDRVIGEDQPVHPGGECPQVEHRPGLDIDQQPPVHARTPVGQADHQLGHKAPAAILD